MGMSFDLINGDCLNEMKKINSNSVDLIITSPPYEDINGSGYKAQNKDIIFFKLYSEFMEKLFIEYFRILKDSGQIFFNIKSKTHKKTLSTPHWFEFLDCFKQFKLKSYIIWKYSGSFDSSDKRFHLDYEIIYHLSKTDDIFLNTNCGLHDCLSSVWNIPHYIKNRLHPTQMPEKVVERILMIASKPNYTVLDSFMGSGTTGVVCKRFDLDFIGIELEKDYFKIAQARIKEQSKQGKI